MRGDPERSSVAVPSWVPEVLEAGPVFRRFRHLTVFGEQPHFLDDRDTANCLPGEHQIG